MPQGSIGGSGPGRPTFAAPNRAGRVPKISVRPPPVTIWQAIKVTKWSINSGESNVSDQQPQPTSGETGTPGAGPAAPDASEPVAAAAEVEDRDRGRTDAAPKARATRKRPRRGPRTRPRWTPSRWKRQGRSRQRPKLPRLKLPRSNAPKIDAVKPEAPRFPGNVTIMSPGDRVGADAKAEAGGEDRPASAGSGRWPPWWRWRRWRVRWVARWRPRELES